MAVRTTAGTTFRISASTPATFDAAGYAAILAGMTLVGEITDLGEFGREYNLVTHEPIDTRGTTKKKGNFSEGSVNLTLGLDEADAGQILMQAALLSDNDYSCLITTQSGKRYYFQSQIMSWKVSVGSVNNITTASTTLEITTSAGGVGIVKV